MYGLQAGRANPSRRSRCRWLAEAMASRSQASPRVGPRPTVGPSKPPGVIGGSSANPLRDQIFGSLRGLAADWQTFAAKPYTAFKAKPQARPSIGAPVLGLGRAWQAGELYCALALTYKIAALGIGELAEPSRRLAAWLSCARSALRSPSAKAQGPALRNPSLGR